MYYESSSQPALRRLKRITCREVCPHPPGSRLWGLKRVDADAVAAAAYMLKPDAEIRPDGSTPRLRRRIAAVIGPRRIGLQLGLRSLIDPGNRFEKVCDDGRGDVLRAKKFSKDLESLHIAHVAGANFDAGQVLGPNGSH